MLDGSYGAMCQMESKSNKSLSGTHVGHVSQLERVEIQIIRQEDKGKSKRANEEVTCGKEGTSHLSMW